MDFDQQIALAIELSKKQAEEETKKFSITGNGNKSEGIKVHDIEVDPDSLGEHLQKGFKYVLY